MLEYLKQFIFDFIGILNDMSFYLLIGFLFAGILKVFIPQSFITHHLGSSNFKSVLYASLLGVPLPLCSCGVIPTGISLYKNGAGKGATSSFLISTPQTGVDSILVTYSLLGLPFAIIRPIVALCTGVFGGVLTNLFDKQTKAGHADNLPIDDNANSGGCGCCCESENISSKDANYDGCDGTSVDSCSCDDERGGADFVSKIRRMLHYAFVDFLQDIATWLVIGLLIAAAISVWMPADFFTQFRGNTLLEMLFVLIASIPLYVCATASVPIAAVLMLKGLSPGAALVFLMAGPATNAATITVLRKELGMKTLNAFLLSIAIGALIFGTLINHFLPQEWFIVNGELAAQAHEEFLPMWLQYISSAILIVLIIRGFVGKRKRKLECSSNGLNKTTS